LAAEDELKRRLALVDPNSPACFAQRCDFKALNPALRTPDRHGYPGESFPTTMDFSIDKRFLPFSHGAEGYYLFAPFLGYSTASSSAFGD
jgi:hypothetical protein